MRVAKSYEGYTFDETKAYEKNGKLYVNATCKCDRCVKGIFPCRIENGMPVPHPAYGGICLQCGGTGILKKEVRLYTDKEFEAMERSKERAAEKRASEREAKMLAEFDEKKKKWLEENGFNAENVTYVYFPADSYDVKETLKENGFRFNYNLFWHIAEIPVGYEDKVIPIQLEDVVEISAWGEGHYTIGSKEKVEAAMKAARPHAENPSEWVGEVKDKIVDLQATLTDIHNYQSRYGISSIVKFVTPEGNILKWFTSVNLNFEVGDEVLVSATIKELVNDKYEDDAKVTIVTRAKLKAV